MHMYIRAYARACVQMKAGMCIRVLAVQYSLQTPSYVLQAQKAGAVQVLTSILRHTGLGFVDVCMPLKDLLGAKSSR